MTDPSETRLPPAVTLSVLGLTASSLIASFFGPPLPTPKTAELGAFLHSIVEWSAVCVALFTACLGFLYYRIRADALVLTVACAALLTGVWDALHAFGSVDAFPAAAVPERFVPFTWAASRTLKATIGLMGAGYVLSRGLKPPRFGIGLWAAGVAAAAATLGAFFVLADMADLPAGLSSGSTLTRPWDVPALVLFIASGCIVFPLVARRHPELLAYVLLLSAAPEAVTQLQMTFLSSALYDDAFVLAHLTKLIACLVPLAGFILGFTRAYRREILGRGRMEKLVTDLVATEEELRVKESHLEQITQGIREVFWISEPDGSKIYYVSPAYEEIFGDSTENLYERPQSFLEFVHPEDRDALRRHSQAVPDGEFEVEYRVVRPDSSLRWLRTRAFPLRNDAGKIYRLSGVTEDITEQKEAVEALRVSEARMRAMFEAVPDLVFRANRSGVVLDFHTHPGGASTRDVVGSQIADVIPPTREQVERALESTLESGVANVLEYRASSDGVTGDFEARFVRSTGDEVLVLVRNVTEQKRLQREILEVSQREQERIGSDLHDGIAQQLTGVALLGQVLVRELVATGRPESERARQIAALVEETLSQTRILARGLAPVQLDQGGFSAALEEMASGIEALYPVRCICRCDQDARVTDHEKAIHLFRIAQEAVTNAIKHASPSSIEISLSRKNGRFELAIRDDGDGMDKERVARSGGMGLHIMRYRARMIAASLDFQPAGSKGTVVACQWSATTDPTSS